MGIRSSRHNVAFSLLQGANVAFSLLQGAYVALFPIAGRECCTSPYCRVQCCTSPYCRAQVLLVVPYSTAQMLRTSSCGYLLLYKIIFFAGLYCGYAVMSQS